MALLSSSVIAELDKRKALHELKTGRVTPSSSPSSGEPLQRRPLRSTPSKTPTSSPAKPLSPEELKQVLHYCYNQSAIIVTCHYSNRLKN